MTFTRIFILITCMSILGMQQSQAEETDQFTLPPKELQDIGPSSSNKLYELLQNVIAQTNSEIQMLKPRAQNSRYSASQLAIRRTDTYIADLLYKKTGPGFPRWLRWGRDQNPNSPIEFKENKPWNTVYWLVFSQSPLFIIGLAPTINMYDYYFGTDKLGHFFMQGHTYFTMYRYLLAHGKSAEQAHATMILYGQVLEQTYLGTLINGVYSNADLSANYAGWKFYMNLAHSVQIGNKTLPPILILKGDKWEFAKQVDKNNLLKPYLSDNLNEALNPCRYAFMRGQILRNVKKRCSNWIERKAITQPFIEAKLVETRQWHGEEYGHWLPSDNLVALNSCFRSP